MSERDTVTCGTHGSTPGTFVCRHVATGSACGFHASVFGEVQGIDRLTTPNRACGEVDGWEMASLAAYVLGGAEGVYRPPFDHVR